MGDFSAALDALVASSLVPDNIPDDVVEDFYQKGCALEAFNDFYGNIQFSREDLDEVSTLLTEVQSCEDPSAFWSFLAENDVSYRVLLTSVYALLRKRDSQLSMIGSRIYLQSLSIPGNVNMFHSLLLTSVLSLLKSWATSVCQADVDQKGAKRRKKKRKSRGDDAKHADADDMNDADATDDDEAMSVPAGFHGNPEEAIPVVRQSLALLSSLLPTPTLKRNIEGRAQIVESSCEMVETLAVAGVGSVISDIYSLLEASVAAAGVGEVSQISIPLLMNLMPIVSCSKYNAKSLTQRVKNTSAECRRWIINTSRGHRKKLELPLLCFVKNLCLQGSTSADFRAITKESVVELLTTIHSRAVMKDFVKFLQRLSKSEHGRLISVELASSLLESSLCDKQDVPIENQENGLPAELKLSEDAKDDDDLEHKHDDGADLGDDEGLVPKPIRHALMDLMFERTADSLAIVRAKAVALLAACLCSAGASEAKENDEAPVVDEYAEALVPRFLARVTLLLRDRSAVMRKSAVEALGQLLVAAKVPNARRTDFVKALASHAQDVSLAVRRKAGASLTEVFLCHSGDAVISELWLSNIPTLMNDREANVQSDGVGLVRDHILNPVIQDLREFGSDCDFSSQVWTLLDRAPTPVVFGIQKAIHVMYQRKADFPELSKLTRYINSAFITSIHKGVWVLLEAIAQHDPTSINVDTLFQVWTSHSSKEASLSTDVATRILRCVADVAKGVSKLKKIDERDGVQSDAALNMASQLVEQLKACASSEQVVPAIISAVHEICSFVKSQHPANAPPRHPIVQWKLELLRVCELNLRKGLRGEIPEKLVLTSLSTLGNLCMLTDLPASRLASSSGNPTKIVWLVQAFLLEKRRRGSRDDSSVAPSSQMDRKAEESKENELLDDIASSQASVASAAQLEVAVSQRVRCQAFVTFGKLMMRSERLAKSHIHLLVSELQTSESFEIRNNILFVLFDLCRTFTLVVDPYFPVFSQCIKDPHPLVRRHALLLLYELLKEDYLKWKTSLFFRYVTALADPDADVRRVAETTLDALQAQKYKDFAAQKFVELIFYLNNHTGHATINQWENPEEEAKFAIVPRIVRNRRQSRAVDRDERDACSKKRMQIYEHLLRRMSDLKRFDCGTRLLNSILGGVIDDNGAGGASLHFSSRTDLFKDALMILASKEIQLRVMKKRALGDADEEKAPLEENAKQARNRATQKLKKAYDISTVIPTLLSFKELCERKRSPLAKQVMEALTSIVSGNQEDISEYFSIDSRTAKELLLDIRRFENEQKENAEHLQFEMVRTNNTPGVRGARPARENLYEEAMGVPRSARRPGSALDAASPFVDPRTPVADARRRQQRSALARRRRSAPQPQSASKKRGGVGAAAFASPAPSEGYRTPLQPRGRRSAAPQPSPGQQQLLAALPNTPAPRGGRRVSLSFNPDAFVVPRPRNDASTPAHGATPAGAFATPRAAREQAADGDNLEAIHVASRRQQLRHRRRHSTGSVRKAAEFDTMSSAAKRRRVDLQLSQDDALHIVMKSPDPRRGAASRREQWKIDAKREAAPDSDDNEALSSSDGEDANNQPSSDKENAATVSNRAPSRRGKRKRNAKKPNLVAPQEKKERQAAVPEDPQPQPPTRTRRKRRQRP